MERIKNSYCVLIMYILVEMSVFVNSSLTQIGVQISKQLYVRSSINEHFFEILNNACGSYVSFSFQPNNFLPLNCMNITLHANYFITTIIQVVCLLVHLA